MAYSTPLQFAERSGLGLRVVDENVGTGDDSETDFDLDKDNIISSSYTLSHSASGSNTFTTLTETTHYTIDKESGRIVLTGSGVTEVGTDIIYATYWYTDTFSDSVITDMVAVADSEIDKLTRRRWGSVTTAVDYLDGRKTSTYPTTDEPFMGDWDAPDKITLKNYPVTKVDNVFFLNESQSISKFFNYDDGTSAYTDKTDDVNSSTKTPFNLFDDSPATNDFIYIGSNNVFLGLDINLSTNGVDNGSTAIDWEYWNGSAWADISETDTDTGASIFTNSGKFTWTYPYGWAKTTVNGENYYWIRGKLTDDYSTDPICAIMTIQDSVGTILNPRDFIFESYGRLTILGARIINGTQNIRVDYSYGQSSVPVYIAQLSILMASLSAYVNLSGGSYNDATSYTLGSKSVTIGEVYVNIREVISQFRARIDELLRMVGRRAKIAVI